MTASDLTDAMYSYSWPLPPHQFKRRVVVAASALNMEEGEKRTVVASGLKGGVRCIGHSLTGCTRGTYF